MIWLFIMKNSLLWIFPCDFDGPSNWRAWNFTTPQLQKASTPLKSFQYPLPKREVCCTMGKVIWRSGHGISKSRKPTHYWKTGVTANKDLPSTPICNPLFMYSSVASDTFAVNTGRTPLGILRVSHAFNLGCLGKTSKGLFEKMFCSIHKDFNRMFESHGLFFAL